MTSPDTWRVRQITPKPHYHPPPPDTSREGPYAGRPTLRRLRTTTRAWTLGCPGTRIDARNPDTREADTP